MVKRRDNLNNDQEQEPEGRAEKRRGKEGREQAERSKQEDFRRKRLGHDPGLKRAVSPQHQEEIVRKASQSRTYN